MAATRIPALLAGLTRRKHLREALVAYSFIAPWIIGFLLFTGGPILASLGLSFFEWRMIEPPSFVGAENYVRLFTRDPLFPKSLKVTTLYVAIAIPSGQLLALLLAILLNQRIRFLSFWRSLFYLPSVVSGVAVTVLWLWMYDPNYGIINHLLEMVGLPSVNWLYSERWSLPALIIKSLWGIGGSMVIYLAGLQGVPQELYEAARIDGAGDRSTFFHITLPMLSPVIFFNLVMGIILGIQTFTEPYLMTGGGPSNATLFLGLYLYQSAFHFLKMGYAAAMAWIMFLIILGVTILQFKAAERWVYYEVAE
ncbi:MAG: sugar ABC transporter permease [Anaerolineae bacterium]